MQIVYKAIDEIKPYKNNPRYCDVIIDRWETYTGKKAVKLSA